MNYLQKMSEMIENGKKEFTHREIINITNTNCPYSVLRNLKKYYEIDYTVETNNTKRYRKYVILSRKEDKCQKTLCSARKQN